MAQTNKKLFSFLVLGLLVLCSCVSGQNTHNGFRAGVFEKGGGDLLPYRLFVPKNYDEKKNYPLVLWMHGGAGRGTDNLRQITGGNKIGSSVWTTPENQAKNPAFVLAAQLPRDGRRSRDGSLERRVRNLQNIVNLIESLKVKYSIDSDRIYVAGQSFGGYGSWWMIANNPEMFAAAVPICGWGDSEKISAAKDVAIWALHGAKDRTIPVERSRELIKAMEKVGSNPKYTEFNDMGHTIWERVFKKQEVIDWVFRQKRTK